MTRHLIEDYRSLPGEHCGSTAMRNLLWHYCGLELPEETVFGLGSGIDCVFLESEDVKPSALVIGRSITMEVDCGLALGVDYREGPDMDDARAWERVRAEVLAGRPTVLSGDCHYLDYRGFDGHFPSHRFVLMGFDDDANSAFVMDRSSPELQECSYESLALSRNPPDFISTHNLWGKFYGTSVGHSLEEAFASALARTALRMLGEDTSQTGIVQMMAGTWQVDAASGLLGIERFLEQLPVWRSREDRATIASYASRCMEKYGTGGGNFRTMFARFLAHARAVVPELVSEEMPIAAAQSATRWTELSSHLERAAEGDEEAAWKSCAETLAQIVDLETRLFESLGTRTI